MIGGNIYQRFGDYSQAVAYYQEAVALLRDITAADHKNEGSRLRLAFAYNGLAATFVRLNNLDAARQTYQDTLSLFSTVLEFDSPNEETIYAVADSYTGLGELEAKRATAESRDRVARLSHMHEACRGSTGASSCGSA